MGGKTYYFCDDGSDSNDGLSPETPLQTVGKARTVFNKMDAGDQLRFCRGGVFYVDELGKKSKWKNGRCRKEKPCLLSDYVKKGGEGGNLQRPVFQSLNGSSVFRFVNGGRPRHQEGIR